MIYSFGINTDLGIDPNSIPYPGMGCKSFVKWATGLTTHSSMKPETLASGPFHKEILHPPKGAEFHTLRRVQNTTHPCAYFHCRCAPG